MAANIKYRLTVSKVKVESSRNNIIFFKSFFGKQLKQQIWQQEITTLLTDN